MTELTILHTNDSHSYLDHFGERAFLINKIRKENGQKKQTTLLLGSGDILSGTVYFNIYHGIKEAELLNLLAYDAVTFGNHEFDDGSKSLARYIEHLDIPLVSSNVHFAEDPYIGPLEQAGKIKPYLFKETENGKKIGIFAMTTMETLKNDYPSPETVFEDPFEVAPKMVAKLKALGADIIILISHLGDVEDVKLANQVDGIHVIVGGHTHQLLREGLKVRNTVIVQAGYYGKYMGELRLKFDDKTNRLLNFREKIHEISLYQLEESIAPFINQMKKEKELVAREKVTRTEEVILGSRNSFKSDKAVLANVVTDAFYNQALEDGYKVDCTVFNTFGIRTDLPKGVVTFGDLVRVLPFSKSLTVFEVTGQDLKKALEHGLAPQVSHLRLAFSGKPEGPKSLLRAEVLLENGQYELVQDEKLYRIASNAFIAAGKDGYDGFKQAKIIKTDLELDVDLLKAYLQSFPEPFHYEVEHRISYRD